MTKPDEEWNLQDAAVRGGTYIPASGMGREDAIRYALIGRVLAEPLDDSLPEDFARSVAEAVRTRGAVRRTRMGELIVGALLLVLTGAFVRIAIAMFNGGSTDELDVATSLAPLLPEEPWLLVGGLLFVAVRCAAFLRRLRLR